MEIRGNMFEAHQYTGRPGQKDALASMSTLVQVSTFLTVSKKTPKTLLVLSYKANYVIDLDTN